MKTKSDTPRTDEKECAGWSGAAICVPSGFARQLERENTQLRDQCDSMLKEQMLRDREIARLMAEVERLKEQNEHFDDCIKQLGEELSSTERILKETAESRIAAGKRSDQWREDAERLAGAAKQCRADFFASAILQKAVAAHEQLVKGQQ